MTAATATGAEQARTFLTALAGGLPDGHTIPLWRKASKRSTYAPSVDAAVREAERDPADLYVGVGFLAPGVGGRLGTNRRPAAADVAGIYGLWLDIDVKAGGAVDMGEAAMAAHAVRRPTLLVDSGHGLHAWHLFPDPWVFADDDEREQAADMARRWVELHRQATGLQLDSVGDLARVLRLPGTLNMKATES